MSSAATPLRRETLSFDANIGYEIVLKYQTGREIANGNIMFSTSKDQVFFLKPEQAQKIHALGLAPNEPFRVLKRVAGSGKNAVTTYVFSRIGQDAPPPRREQTWEELSQPEQRQQQQPPTAPFARNQPAAPPAAPTHTTNQGLVETAPPQNSAPNKSLSNLMASSYIAAIDALIVAKQYADQHAVTFRIDEGKISKSAHCLFIQACRDGATWQQR